LRTQQLTQPDAVAAAYAATVRSLVSVIATFNAEIIIMEQRVRACFGQARDAEIYLSQPGLGPIPARRKPYWPATSTTNGSSTPCTSKPSARYVPHPRLLRLTPQAAA